MLRNLYIKSVALIDKAELEFSSGFTVLTGETGAGKSILIDAINLLTGSRASRELIRHGDDKCVVRAIFEDISEGIIKQIEDFGDYIEAGENCVEIERTLYADGRSTAKISGRSVTNAVLKKISSLLININGQQDSVSLLDETKHIEFLDLYAGLEKQIEEYRSSLSELQGIRRKKEAVHLDEREKARRIDELKYWINDIESAHLKPGEEEALTAKKTKLKNAEKINTLVTGAGEALYSSNGENAFDLISRASNHINSLSEIIPELAPLSERIGGILYEIESAAQEINAYRVNLSDNPGRLLDRIEDRLEHIHRLKRKYGDSIAEILEYSESAKKELESISVGEEELKKLNDMEKDAYQKTAVLAEKLTKSRIEYGKKLSAEINRVFTSLDMEKVEFCVSLNNNKDENNQYIFGENGADILSFLIKTNSGEPFKPLSKIASGGELSRCMLALRTVLSKNDGVETLIFDEIDTGVSGKTSRKIGFNLKELSKNTQVFCVTHAAQICSLGDYHYKISKSETDGRTYTKATQLSDSERIEEVARLIGGLTVTEASRQSARELLENK